MVAGGWAIDAKLNRITRDHEDIDITYPSDRSTDFLSLLDSFGCVMIEQTSYGFLADRQGILLDCEPCIRVEDGYELEGLPAGTCPVEPSGSLGGKRIRCTSWEAILWIIFTTSKRFPRASGEQKIFLVLL